MPLNPTRARQLLKEFNFRSLFIDELGWDNHNAPLEVTFDGQAKTLQGIAQKRGMVAYYCSTPAGERLPEYAVRRKIEHHVAKAAHEHLIVFTDTALTTQIWQWVKREPGKPAACREHTFHKSQPGDALLQKLESIVFTLDEEETLSLTDVTRRARAGFDVERVTKRFYEQFQKEHGAFLKFIEGITESADREWYASVMLNRLMFVYFIQRKGFLDGDRDYLRNRLNRCQQEKGKDQFYSFYRYFLLRLFHEGFGKRPKERAPDLEKLLGQIPYLNGGFFEQHQVEQRYSEIQIPDSAFERIFNYFDQYQWHLDERPLRADNEINPDVLGFIFEKYINQKQMGAYYTKEDITEYISKNTVIPFLFDAARPKCKVAFERQNDSPANPIVWDLLAANSDRYVYPAVRHGTDLPLPPDIAAGEKDVSKRANWNKPAPGEYALPTEIWREVVARRKRCQEIKAKLVAGEVRDINELITLNLDIRQFAQDVIEESEGPELLRAFWHAIERVTILDPTCGSGAFLFAALNILEPLYEACLNRMEVFVEDLDRSGEKHRPEKFNDFRKVLERVDAHPNRRYFIFKSIILNNLFGVDIMEEAIEICKLRLFLKLAAQVDPDTAKENLGIEPLPDIDFNIRAGNTLVGYATAEEVRRCMTQFGGGQLKLLSGDELASYERFLDRLQIVDAAWRSFRQQQTELGGAVTAKDKTELEKKLKSLEHELNGYLVSEYGVKQNNKDGFTKWVKSHQPFHWFIEFYGIISNGGFDVIIGNPPYLEYSKVNDYSIRNYRTERTGNLYVFTVERASALCSSKGRAGMIIPISVACSGAMELLRQHLFETSRTLWLSHFSNRPGQLFTGAQNRLTIFLTSGRVTAPAYFSTRYHRWDARNGEREGLFALIRYHPLQLGASMFHGLLPKAGCPEATALGKIKTTKTVEFFSSRQGRHKVYWVRVPGYFCQFLLEPPMARPEGGGAARVRGEVNDIAFADKLTLNVVHAVLNSSTYYQFFCTYTDTRHINPSDVAEFPLDVSAFSQTTKDKLAELSTKLSRCFGKHTTQLRKSGLLIDSVDSKLCKPIIDEIDRVLAKHYGFTDEEVDFILNYDIKYRLGVGEEGGDD